MKRMIPAVLIFVLLMSLAACGVTEDDSAQTVTESPATIQNEAGMKIEQMTYSDEDIELFGLLEALTDIDNLQVYDYNVDETIQSAKISYYTLDENLVWQNCGSVSAPITAQTGKIALYCKKDLGFRTAWKNGNGVLKSESDDSGFTISDTQMTGTAWCIPVDITINKEIPLSMTLVSSTGSIEAGINDFYEPENLGGYALVTAVTITFSDASLDDVN